jgi:hypothetical protein
MHFYCRIRILLPAIVLLLSSVSALADAVAYSGVVDLRAESGAPRVEHHHDWSRTTETARQAMFSTTKDPFTAANTYWYLRVVHKASGGELFKAPVPALTHLWISPDSRYVVGLSQIKRLNPFQLVVFSRAGRRLFKYDVLENPWPSVMQSVTNAVVWYKEPANIRLTEARGNVILSIEDRGGTMREFRFPAGN